MTYLIRTNKNIIIEKENYDDVITELRKLTASWCATEEYMKCPDNPEWKELFEECLANRRFNDIAQVYSVDAYFNSSLNRKIPCDLYLMEYDTPTTIKRIF